MNTKLDSLIKFLLTVDKSAAESVYILKIGAWKDFPEWSDTGEEIRDARKRAGLPEDPFLDPTEKRYDRLFDAPSPGGLSKEKKSEDPEIIGYLPDPEKEREMRLILKELNKIFKDEKRISIGEKFGLFRPNNIEPHGEGYLIRSTILPEDPYDSPEQVSIKAVVTLDEDNRKHIALSILEDGANDRT